MFRFVAILGALAFASAEIIRPCAHDLSYSCVADYLIKVAGCDKPTISEPIDTVDTSEFKIETPYFKGTITRYNNTFQGLASAEIIAFYVDTDAGKTVWSVKFPTLVSYGRAEIWYHSIGAIDYEVDTAFRTTYGDVRFTAQWKGVDQITVGTARGYSKIRSVSYHIEKDWPELNADIGNTQEGVAELALKAAVENPEVLAREEALSVGLHAGIAYWNTYLCSNLDPSVLIDQYN